MLKTYDIPSLPDSVVELTSRFLLIDKMMKEESTIVIKDFFKTNFYKTEM